MGLFSGKKQINSEEYEKLVKMYVEMNASLTLIIQRIQAVEQKFGAVDTNMHSLRGLINKKLGTGALEDVGAQPQNTKTPIPLS